MDIERFFVVVKNGFLPGAGGRMWFDISAFSRQVNPLKFLQFPTITPTKDIPKVDLKLRLEAKVTHYQKMKRQA